MFVVEQLLQHFENWSEVFICTQYHYQLVTVTLCMENTLFAFLSPSLSGMYTTHLSTMT